MRQQQHRRRHWHFCEKTRRRN